MQAQQIIIDKLNKIEQGIENIKENMIEVDFVTEEERELLDESFKNEKKGTLVSLKSLENARNKA